MTIDEIKAAIDAYHATAGQSLDDTKYGLAEISAHVNELLETVLDDIRRRDQP